MSEMGLRERKNARTAAAIERAALELTLEQGFERTTVDQIAARADVSPRTVFVRYKTKEAIVERGDPETAAADFAAALDSGDGDLLDRVGVFIGGMIAAGAQDEIAELRLRATLSDPHLRAMLHSRLELAERMFVTRVTEELGLAPDDVRARALGGGVTGLLLAIVDRAFVDREGFDPVADLETGLGFLRAGLAQLTA